jgi:hypothetical protein
MPLYIAGMWLADCEVRSKEKVFDQFRGMGYFSNKIKNVAIVSLVVLFATYDSQAEGTTLLGNLVRDKDL